MRFDMATSVQLTGDKWFSCAKMRRNSVAVGPWTSAAAAEMPARRIGIAHGFVVGPPLHPVSAGSGDDVCF